MLETPYTKIVKSNSEYCEEKFRNCNIRELNQEYTFNIDDNSEYCEEKFRNCNIRELNQEYTFNIDDSNRMGLFLLKLQADIDEHIENARVEIIRQIARENDVSFTLAEWWFNKNMKLVVDLEKEEIRSEFLSVEEILANIEVETEYDRKMKKELMKSTLGKVKR